MTHLVPLGATGWSLWRDAGLRSAGFPAGLVRAVCDPELARAVDDGDTEGHPAAAERLRAAISRVAADPLFRHAVAWQNPALMAACLDKLVRGEPRNVRGRLHESTVVRYLQRYALKNDTIGFFGPVGWASVSRAEPALRVVPGERLLAGRTTHFEMWAMDAVASAFARRPELAGRLVPRPALGVTVRDGWLLRPLRPAVRLTDDEIAAYRRCDGHRTVHDIGADAILDRLAGLGAVHIGLDGPVDSWPERRLRQLLGDDEAELAALVEARDAVGAATSAEQVVAANDRLACLFERVTGAAATRRPGEAYAGRTLVYSDTRRDVEVVLGRAVLDALAAPLGLLLDSARWLVAAVGTNYRELLLARAGCADVPLPHLIALAAPDLTASAHALPPPVAAAVREFQRKWARIVAWPAGARRHTVASADINKVVTAEFGDATVPWRAAMHHSPDVLVAATGPDAVARGDFQLVLGELHLAVNSLDNRFFVRHHDEPGRLLAAAEADFGGRRIYAALPKTSPFVSSRVWPPVALVSDQYTYWSWSGDPSSVRPPGPVIAGLVLRRDGRVYAGDVGYDLLEVLGEILSTAVVNAFRPFAPAPHRPRVTIDRLVVARETWTFPAADTAWAFVKAEPARFAAARAWRARYGLPERVFAVLPVERKPIGVDFTSIALVNVLAKEIRRTAEHATPRFTVSEMLPDLDRLWLPDRAGRTYTSEFRMVAVDGSVTRGDQPAAPCCSRR